MVTSSVGFLRFIFIFSLNISTPFPVYVDFIFYLLLKNRLGPVLLMFKKTTPSLPLSSNILVMVRGSWCKIICWHIWLSWQAVHKADVQSQIWRKSGCCRLATAAVIVWGSRRQFLTAPGFSALALGPLQRLLMPAQGTGSLTFLKARELLHEKASIVSSSIRLPSVPQHKKSSVHFHSTELATAGKPSAWRERGPLGTAAAAPAGSGAAFRLLRGQCQLYCDASQGAWLQGIPCLSQAMNPKGHKQFRYECSFGRKLWKKLFLSAEKGWGWHLPGVGVQLTSDALGFPPWQSCSERSGLHPSLLPQGLWSVMSCKVTERYEIFLLKYFLLRTARNPVWLNITCNP